MNSSSQILHNVVSPFCPLHCDDLSIRVDGSRLTIEQTQCQCSHSGFAQLANVDPATSQPMLNGQSTSLEQALTKAAELLNQAHFPTIVAAADVSASAAAISLAQQCGGVIDHPNSAALLRNLQAMQSDGWISTSLSEARNRADVMVVFGEQILSRYPCLVDQVLQPAERLFDYPCDVIVVGKSDRFESIYPLQDDLNATVGVLRALLGDAPLDVDVGDSLTALAKRLSEASYPVLIWSAREFDFAHAELMVENILGLIRDLSQHNRCTGLALAAADGGTSALQVNSWRSGFPLRTAFHRGFPEYDVYHYDHRRLIASSETDLLVWINTFPDTQPPPASDIPAIVLGYPGIELNTLNTAPAVFIPVGIPGIDHAGQLFRSDGVALQLTQLRQSEWQPANAILQQLSDALT